MWLDALRYKVRHDSQSVCRAANSVSGLNQEGYKDLLGMYVIENEDINLKRILYDQFKSCQIELYNHDYVKAEVELYYAEIMEVELSVGLKLML